VSNDKDNIQNIKPHPGENAPGCGLASYSCLLILLFLVGVTGIITSTLALYQSSFQREPFSLAPGNQVEVWRLQPMRDAKLLELTEIPEVYHDESRNGVTACALNDVYLLRLDRGKGWKVPYTDITNVTSHRKGEVEVAVIHINESETLSCIFAPGEGVGRFVRAVKAHL
jgi:hypothetical protein